MKFDYDQHGKNYAGYRRTDLRIAALVHDTLGNARTVLNVGAGAGSYEPYDRYVVAVEPSHVMRSQRKVQGRYPAINTTADSLPFDDRAFDAAMAMVTVHHWPDMTLGLKELRRVANGPVVVMTFDPDALDLFWNVHYFRELVEIERSRYPSVSLIAEALGGQVEVKSVPIPLDCTDGFQEAFYGRPEAFLNPEIRKSQSAWGFLPEGKEAELVQRLEAELITGEWDRKYGFYRQQPFFNGALRLVIARP